ncbi:hypothetical protein BCR34DRAFT_643413 [Clohesyomyces aquaticus]|uniref:Uncharacterized protein n=1 Tax=Clohesyomyces aquaticus TaxID=1231657 RepID=A0A1Y1ZYD3_9PLEO|nr:hypothetical protein BCR34DRAFT_643413 [Clohesyomyces aquaticus]
MLFSSLVPAIFFNATVNLPIVLGPTATGSTLTYADLVSGTFVSEPGFTPSITGHAIRGGDYITIDPSGAILRLHLDTLIATSDTPPQYIRIQASGAEVATPDVWDIVTNPASTRVVKFGDFQATSSWTFSANSSGKYAELEKAVYVGSTSLRGLGKESGGKFQVGFKIAQVVSVKTGGNV